MRLLISLSIAIAAVLYALWGERPVAAVEPTRTFRVATFNIHKGADNENRYTLDRTIAAIAALEADVVGVQEAMRNDPQLRCDDQPALMADGLRRITGERWSHAYARSWTTENRACLEQRRGDGVATEGVAILTRHRILTSEELPLAESRVALMVRVAAMPDVPVIVTHLAASRRNQHQRVAQIGQLLPWARRLGPGILIGDFNARPEWPEAAPLLAGYKDAWVDAWERGITSGVPHGGTRPFGTSRIDFVLYALDAPLTVTSAAVLSTAAEDDEVEVSDHRPVIATFRRQTAR